MNQPKFCLFVLFIKKWWIGIIVEKSDFSTILYTYWRIKKKYKMVASQSFVHNFFKKVFLGRTRIFIFSKPRTTILIISTSLNTSKYVGFFWNAVKSCLLQIRRGSHSSTTSLTNWLSAHAPQRVVSRAFAVCHKFKSLFVFE